MNDRSKNKKTGRIWPPVKGASGNTAPYLPDAPAELQDTADAPVPASLGTVRTAPSRHTVTLAAVPGTARRRKTTSPGCCDPRRTNSPSCQHGTTTARQSIPQGNPSFLQERIAEGDGGCPDIAPDTPSSGVLLRLNKAIAVSGLCSRRKADACILEGRVCVNGLPVQEPGTQVDPQHDRITVDGIPLRTPGAPVYLMLHKPVQVVCTAADPQGRTTVLDLLPAPWRQDRLYPVGRLDFFSEGLLLLTNDGDMALRLAHPRYHLPKTYEVLVREEVPQTALTSMRKGMTLAEGERLAPVEVTCLPSRRGTLLRMVLHEGRNRQIRRMCRDLDLTILRLRRVAQGPLHLGTLPPGETRPLTLREVSLLRQALGLPIVPAQGVRADTTSRFPRQPKQEK